MMKEYWFYLETYVFLWSDYREILIYNTLSGNGYLYHNHPELRPVISGLEDKSNLYCITINENDLKVPAIKDFIHSIQENFCGDLLDKSVHTQKPLVVIPKLNVNEEVYTGVKTIKRDVTAGIHAEKNLLELTVYLTGMCKLDCKDCRHTCRQIPWCFKNDRVLQKEILFNTLKQTVHTSLTDVKFMGGDVFSYPFWDELMDELKKYAFKKSFCADIRLPSSNPKQLEIFEETGFFLEILIDVSDSREQIIHREIPINPKYSYLFKIKSVEEYEIVQSILDRYPIESKIIPYYDGTNLSFFKDHIFQTLDEIINTPWRKNEIFAHIVVNTHDFGKFTLLSDGKIYANVNFEPIGNAESDDIKALVNQELKHGKSWLLNRNKIDPCKNCLYKYLCPSPSNYEIAIGRPNLCHVKS